MNNSNSDETEPLQEKEKPSENSGLNKEALERKSEFRTLSGFTIPKLLTAEGYSTDALSRIGTPGEYPYTRGIHASMYRARLWTMRQFSGFGTAKDTNERFHFLLSQGGAGLSCAFDMPTLMGYDADHAMARGEVGREGVAVSTIEDMAALFSDINLGEVSVSMTINCTAAPVLAMFLANARRNKVPWEKIRGTIQNDILKEFIAQKEWISPPEASLRLSADVMEFCSQAVPQFYPISVSGYHIREAGSTAVQELAFTLYNGLTYVEECLKRGMAVDSFAPRISFFFDVHNDFFEEVAKFRAARRLWARLMKERFGPKDPNSLKLRMHTQTAGVSLTAQQPVNNVARVALQAFAAVCGGTQSLHTNALDETLSLPTENAAKIALRTQQIIAEETGVANVVDPLAGSFYLEHLTDEIEKSAEQYIQAIDKMGGMLAAIDQGYPQCEIADAAYSQQLDLEDLTRVVVGVNKYSDREKVSVPTLHISPEIEQEQIERIRAFKNARSEQEIEKVRLNLTQACVSHQNVMPALIDAVDCGMTVGEVADVFREVFGVYEDPGFI